RGGRGRIAHPIRQAARNRVSTCTDGIIPVRFLRPMLTQRRFVIGAALIAAAVSYLVYAGIRTTSMYYFELGEFLAQRDAHVGEALRVKGFVRHGSMRWDARTSELAFDLARSEDRKSTRLNSIH